MKCVILAGGLGTRISEETENKPKPMVIIGDKPILWHLMKIFSIQGFDEFVLALGYRGDVIKRWALDLNDLAEHKTSFILTSLCFERGCIKVCLLV